MLNSEKTMEKLVALCKNRGFIYAGSEIYGGLANSWDYGPLGVELKNNIKRAWWKKFVQENPYNVGLDSAILMNPQVWVASGHVTTFNDPLIDCKSCKSRHRADKLIEDWLAENPMEGVSAEAMSNEEMVAFIREHNIPCPVCGKCDFTDIRKFNLMFKTHQGVTEDTASEVYLRPETAQGIFVNFKNIQRTTRRKIPFGVCQIGKSFRNEITPGNFIFRIREFEQMELEFFCEPGTDLEWFAYWRGFCRDWLTGLGMREENLRLRDHDPAELAFYSKATTDFEYLFPFGWGRALGRCGPHGLRPHPAPDPLRAGPHVFRPGEGRALCALRRRAQPRRRPRHPRLPCGRLRRGGRGRGEEGHACRAAPAPRARANKVAVLPLSKKEVLSGPARELYAELSKDFMCEYDDTGSIGKRYRRQDEIGTPYCVTLDFTTVGDDKTEADHCVTVRERDSMQQVRLPISELKAYLAEKLAY